MSEAKEMIFAKKICENCADWQGFEGRLEKFECLNAGDCAGRLTSGSDTCESFRPDPSIACTICGGIAEEGDYSSMHCVNNDNHIASQWDYEWHDFSDIEDH